MKLYKQRFESKELLLYRRLKVRGNLNDEELAYLSYLEKGFEGEKKFDEWTSKLSDNWLFLDDFLFEIHKSECQIDSIGMNGDTIHLFDVKNFEGDYILEGSKWIKNPKIDVKNPYEQLMRAESKFRRLLNELGFNFKIEPHLVFVNPDFFLYQTPMNLPIIFPSQIQRFMNYLNLKSSKINANHIKLAEKLVALHKAESMYAQYPEYGYEQLKKGITCVYCASFSLQIKKGKLVCQNCGRIEELRAGVLRSVEEIRFLFPDIKISTNAVYEWCELYKWKKGIRMILHDNFKMIGHGKYSYFDKL